MLCPLTSQVKSNRLIGWLVRRLINAQGNRFKSKRVVFADGNDAFVTGIVLYRNLGSILSLQR